MNSKLTRWCEGFLEAGWLFALIATPLFFNIHSERVFEPDKITLLRSTAVMMLLIWLVKFIDQQGWKDWSWLTWKSKNSIWRTPLVLPVTAIVISYFLSTLFSVAPRTSFWGSYQRLQGTYTTLSYIAIFAVILGNLRTQEQIQRLITTVIVCSIPASIYGFLQHYKIDPLPWGGNTSTRIAGHMGNAIFLGAYLMMAVPLTVARIIDGFKRILTDVKLSYADVIRSSIYLVLLGCQMLAIYWTQSRGPLLGVAIGMFAFILIMLVTLRNAAVQSDSQFTLKDAIFPLAFVGVSVFSLLAADMFTSGATSFGLWLGVTSLLLVAIFVLAAAQIGWRWLWLAWISVITVAGVIIVLFNVSSLTPAEESTPVIGFLDDTFDEWRELPTIGRFGDMLNTESGTSTVRLLIWGGVLDLISLHDPIQSPVSGADTWNFLRPLIGYGPESMYVAYNSFYPPELATVEARNASPDRSHNETFDALVITGLLGFLAWQILYASTFYYGFQKLDVIDSKRDRNLFFGLWIGGALVVSIVALILGGAIYLGVAIPFGSIIGLILYLVYYALFGRSQTASTEYNINTLVIASLIAAMIAYYVEIHFGIAIASTRTHAFVFTALIVVIGSSFLDSIVESEKVEEVIEKSGIRGKSKRKSRRTRTTAKRTAGSGWVWPTIAAAGIMSAMMITLMFDFTNYTIQSGQQIRTIADVPSASDIFQRAFFTNPRQQFVDSPYLYGVTILSWLLGSLLFVCEMVRGGQLRTSGGNTIESGRLKIAGGVMVGMALAGLLGLVSSGDDTSEHLLRVARMSGIFWTALSAIAAATLFITNSAAGRVLGGIVSGIGALLTIPLFVAGATIPAVLIGVLSIAGIILLWEDGWRPFTLSVLIIGLISLIIGLIYALVHAGMLREVLFLAPEGLQGLERRIAEAIRIGKYLNTYYTVAFGTVLLASLGLAWQSMSSERNNGSIPGLIALPIALILGIFLCNMTNLNIIKADMIYKRGKPYDQQAGRLINQAVQQTGEEQVATLENSISNWRYASAIYEEVVSLTPNEDFYFLWLGRSYLEQSRVNAGEQESLLDTAAERLETAQNINPLNTDHTANLARLNTRWADIRRDQPEERAERIQTSKAYYEDALALSPQNSLIRNEYANLFFQMENDCSESIRVYEESVEADPYYSRTYIALGDILIKCSSREGEPRQEYLDRALELVDFALSEEGIPTRLQNEGVNNSLAAIKRRVAVEINNDGDPERALAIAEEAVPLATANQLTALQTFITNTISATQTISE